MDSLANGQSLTIKDEALLSLSLVQDIFSEKSKNVHVLSMALQVLRAAGILAGGKLRVIAQSIVILTDSIEYPFMANQSITVKLIKDEVMNSFCRLYIDLCYVCRHRTH